MNKHRNQEKTIADFGSQWTLFTTNEGYYSSQELLADLMAPYITLAEINGKRCAEIGAGTGRITSLLVDAGAASVVALEPSEAYNVLIANTNRHGTRVECIKARGEAIPRLSFDLILSIGVLHHIETPKPVIDAAFEALRPGGRILIWLYGKEGSGMYRLFFLPARLITRQLPLSVNKLIADVLYPFTLGYALVARHIRFMPLANYLKEVWLRFDRTTRKLAIIDQLNPQTARYYSRTEARALLLTSGFTSVDCHHRRGYSWTVIGTK